MHRLCFCWGSLNSFILKYGSIKDNLVLFFPPEKKRKCCLYPSRQPSPQLLTLKIENVVYFVSSQPEILKPDSKNRNFVSSHYNSHLNS